MQGQRSSLGSLPELSFHHGSAASDSSIDPQRCWNNMMNPSQEGHQHHISGWGIGETSSSVARDQILSLNNVDPSLNTEQSSNECLFMQSSSSSAIPQVHNSNLQFTAPNEEGDGDDCQVLGCVTPGIGSSSAPFVAPSGTGGYIVEESGGGASGSLDGRRVSCKRKTLEGDPGSSSGSGNSNYLQAVDGSLWHTAAAHNIAAPTGNNLSINFSEQVNPGLGLSIGGAASDVPVTSRASRSVEHVRRHLRSRMNGLHQQDSSSTGSAGGNFNVLSAQRSMRLQPNYNPVELTPFSATDNRSVQRLTVPSLRRNPQSRSNRVPSTVAEGSSSAIPGERVAVPVPPSNISAHPMFIPSINVGNASQNPVNWGLAAGNINTSGNIASTSRVGPSSGVNNPPALAAQAPSLVSHRNSPNYQRRLSDFLRRSLYSAVGVEPGEDSSYNMIPGSSSSQGTALPLGSGNHIHHRLQSRSLLLERHLASAHGVSPSARALAAATPEGRSRLVSEIRSVLDLMRRGEGLRLEDVMILDQSVFFGMADLQDRHRDMRLDVDNMSYEELLALGERIGDVCTGLNEETITSQLKQTKFTTMKTEGQVEVEPCSVCQEEYNNGEDLGTLECGHDFHSDCIKQWLMQKNLCPICKTTGLTTK